MIAIVIIATAATAAYYFYYLGVTAGYKIGYQQGKKDANAQNESQH